MDDDDGEAQSFIAAVTVNDQKHVPVANYLDVDAAVGEQTTGKKRENAAASVRRNSVERCPLGGETSSGAYLCPSS
jgi:hypothetical protein